MLVTGNSLVDHGHSATSELPAHEHSISTANLAGRFSADIGANSSYGEGNGIVYNTGSYASNKGDSEHTHYEGRNYEINATHSHSIGSTGGDAAHNNLQPYEVVYRWKRVA